MAMLASSSEHSKYTFVCKICGKTFLEHEKAIAEEHIRREHRDVVEKSLECKICGEKFLESDIDKIVVHIKEKHPIEYAILIKKASES